MVNKPSSDAPKFYIMYECHSGHKKQPDKIAHDVN